MPQRLSEADRLNDAVLAQLHTTTIVEPARGPPRPIPMPATTALVPPAPGVGGWHAQVTAFPRSRGEAYRQLFAAPGDRATVSTQRKWNDACESHHGWVHRCVEFFASRIRAVGCACADVENILMRMMQTESGGDPHAPGKGCYGLMQLNPTTMRSMVDNYGLDCSSNPFDDNANILCATAYYVENLETFGGSYRKACAGYNWGPHRQVIRDGNERAYRPITQAYVEKALALQPGSITGQGSTYLLEHHGHRSAGRRHSTHKV